MQRLLEPEILDSLPPDHPDALHNRRDLRLTNHIAGNFRWFARTLPRLVRPDERVLEIGAGTGELGQRLAARGCLIDGLDLWPRPATWSADRAWHVGDLRKFEGYHGYDTIFGNLIFHQFSAEDLAALGERLRRTARVILASEPERQRLSQFLFRTLGPLLGANYVSLHDARVSIAAGFRGDELPRMLGLAARTWDVRCTTSLLGAYRMVAIRRHP
jgi:2-polyprenyl-3-methyl-5-hydroxy-6-metoxy-1,4-benzoquinol methylase